MHAETPLSTAGEVAAQVNKRGGHGLAPRASASASPLSAGARVFPDLKARLNPTQLHLPTNTTSHPPAPRAWDTRQTKSKLGPLSRDRLFTPGWIQRLPTQLPPTALSASPPAAVSRCTPQTAQRRLPRFTASRKANCLYEACCKPPSPALSKPRFTLPRLPLQPENSSAQAPSLHRVSQSERPRPSFHKHPSILKMPPTGPRRGGGIRKHQNARRDRDGDLVMGAAPKLPALRPQTTSSRGLTELKVTGWTDVNEIPKVIKFLERHAAKRLKGAKSGGGTSALVKRSRHNGTVLTISVRTEDAPTFGRISGFSFTSHQNGAQVPQILEISGPGIRGAGAEPVVSAADSTKKNETIELLKGFLERRYDPELKLLNLSSIAEDEQVCAVGMFASTSTQSKFVPVLMTIIEQQLETPEQRREAIQSITLSNNNLPNLNMVRDVAITLPHIKNLDLSGNKLKSTKDLQIWKSKLRGLEHLILSGNPLETSQPDYARELLLWFPRLRILNSETVRTEAQIARLDGPKETPVPSSHNLWLDGDNIAQTFVVEFIQGFDNDRNALVQKYYDHESTFTMAVNTRVQGGAKVHDKTPWDAYLPQSRNMKFISSAKTRFRRKYRGTEAVLKAFSTFPPTRHPGLDTNKYSMDCQPQPGLPDPTGQYAGVTGLLVVIHGEYEEHRTARGANEIVRRAFDRTFTLGPGGPTGVRVLNDLCCLRAAGGSPAWIPHDVAAVPTPTPTQAPVQATAHVPVLAASGLTPEQEAMVLHVHQATKLTIELATQCLQAANWDLNTAAEVFNAQKDNLPPEAFVTV